MEEKERDLSEGRPCAVVRGSLGTKIRVIERARSFRLSRVRSLRSCQRKSAAWTRFFLLERVFSLGKAPGVYVH
jgi:hypothetical protein